MKRALLLFAILLTLAGSSILSGCIALPSVFSDERTLSAQYDDAAIKTSIASAMLKNSPSKANEVNVHCFKGHVFLIGEADRDFRRYCLETAQKTPGVVHVTTHWFASGTGNTAGDTSLEARIDAALLFTKDVSSTQVVVDVWGGNVVLTGIMADQADLQRAIKAVRDVNGVKSVTSYLTSNLDR